MRYILIETDPTITHRLVEVTTPVDALSTSQVSALTATQIVTDTTPGVKLYQCIDQSGGMTYRDMGGALFDLIGGSFVVDANPPAPSWDTPEAPLAISDGPALTIISKLDYMNRFQDAELAAIYSAAKTSVQIEIWLEKFKVSEHIDLSDQRTVGGVYALEAAGLIGIGKADEILA